MSRMLSGDEEKEINNKLDAAEMIGEGPVTKGVQYVVYKLQDKFYAVILEHLNGYVCSIEEIGQSEVENYVDLIYNRE